MNWLDWAPQEYATLCFIVKNGQILLIRKKRGLGAGKINAPGGKVEPGESAEAAAIRETQEEVGVAPVGISERGVLRFQFADGYRLQCTVFAAEDLDGLLVETPEAIPLWFPVERIPYDEMWADDRHWLPLLLEGKSFIGSFEFDGDRMESMEIEVANRDFAALL